MVFGCVPLVVFALLHIPSYSESCQPSWQVRLAPLVWDFFNDGSPPHRRSSGVLFTNLLEMSLGAMTLGMLQCMYVTG